MTIVFREKVSKPISKLAEVTDLLLFEDPNNPQQKLFLPRYRISEQEVLGRSRFQVSLEDESQGGVLKVELREYPAEEIQGDFQSARPLLHSLKLLLRFKSNVNSSANVQKELEFQEINISESKQVSGTLRADNLFELTEIYQALTEYNTGAQLIIRRSAEIAIPVDSSSLISGIRNGIADLQRRIQLLQQIQQNTSSRDKAEQGVPLHKNFQSVQFNCDGKRNLVTVIINFYGTPITLKHFFVYFSTETTQGAEIVVRVSRNSFEVATSTLNSGHYDKVVHRGTPRISGSRYLIELPWATIFGNKDEVETWVYSMETKDRMPDAGNYTFLRSQCRLVAPDDFVISEDLKAKQEKLDQLKSQLSELEANSRFQEVEYTFEENAIFFAFPQPLHSYIFQGLSQLSIERDGLIRRQVGWQGGFYSYYQSHVQSHIFYYLPTTFKLVRRDTVPYYPKIAFQFFTPKSSEEVRTSIEFSAAPFVEAERLAMARDELKQYVSDAAGDREVELQPLLVDEPRLFLKLRQADGSLRKVERPEVSVDLRTGFHDAITLSLQDFQAVYDAILSGNTSLFQGEVEVNLSDGFTESIKLTVRFNDLIGEIFDYQITPGARAGQWQLKLNNAIESQIQINEVRATLHRGAAQTEATLTAFEPLLPLDLAPDETLSCKLIPAAALEGNEPLKLQFNLTGVEVLPNKDAIWYATLSPDVPAVYQKNITVRAFNELFVEQIFVVSIDFKNGGTVDFTRDMSAEQLSAEMSIAFPISDLVLRKENSGDYEYKVTVITNQGEFSDADWRIDSSETLWITNTKLPKGASESA